MVADAQVVPEVNKAPRPRNETDSLANPRASAVVAPSPSTGSDSREALAWSLAVFAFALAIRGLELTQLTAHPIFDLRMGDGRVYHLWAVEIAGGDWVGSRVFYQAPGYPYFLAVVYRLFGDSLLATRLVQIVLGALGCAFLTRAGWHFFSKPVGIAAGLILAVYAPAMFADVVIQKSVLDLFLMCVLLAIMSALDAARRPGSALLLGLTVGALILTRENTLVFLFILVPWLAIGRSLAPASRWKTTLLFIAGVAAILLPVAVRNGQIDGEFHLTTSQFGHNFFIGNNAAADGTYRPLLYARGDPLVERDDAVRIVASALGRTPTDTEVSSFYTERALEFIRSEPGRWLALMGRKGMLAINRTELVDTQDQYTHAEYVWVLRASGTVFHFGVLAPLAFFGGWICFRRFRRLWPLYAMVISFGGSLLIFYVFGRYRLPIVPILALFAAAGIVGAGSFVRSASRREVVIALASCAGVALLANWPLLDETYMRSVTHYNIANELVASGDVDSALVHYSMAIDLHDQNALANHNRGVLLAQRGDLASAIEHFTRALRISPRYAEAHFNLARAHAEAGRSEVAMASYRRGLEIEPARPEIHVELGRLLLGAGDLDGAEAAFDAALDLAPDATGATDGLAAIRLARARLVP